MPASRGARTTVSFSFTRSLNALLPFQQHSYGRYGYPQHHQQQQHQHYHHQQQRSRDPALAAAAAAASKLRAEAEIAAAAEAELKRQVQRADLKCLMIREKNVMLLVLRIHV